MTEAQLAKAKNPKAKIIQRRGAHQCTDKHQWEEPWPTATVRQCAHCHAWLIPPTPQPTRQQAKTKERP